mgnify:FL=1
MKKLIWTDEMIETLRNLYPVETNSYTASVLGVSEKSVNKKASELGIGKFAKSKWLERAEYIRCYFYDKSFAEIGKELGISKWSVSRIAGQIGLKRTDKETSHVSSRVRGELIRRERRRMIFGLEPLTNIKVVTNRARIRLRSRLKAKGYVVSDERNVMYYPADLERQSRQENVGIKLGLKFKPLPVEEKVLVATAI